MHAFTLSRGAWCMWHTLQGPLPKMGFYVSAGQTLQRTIIKLCEKTDAIREHVLLWRRRYGAHWTTACGIESISGSPHWEDSYQRTVRAIDAKIGVSMVVDMVFHDILPLEVASPPPNVRVHTCKRQKGCKYVGRK